MVRLRLIVYLLRMMYHNKANLGKINHPGTQYPQKLLYLYLHLRK